MKDEIYETFMKEYRIKHEVCPKCGKKPHIMSTLLSYIFLSSSPDAYRDMNYCTCSNCGDTHIYHDRISLEKFNSRDL